MFLNFFLLPESPLKRVNSFKSQPSRDTNENNNSNKDSSVFNFTSVPQYHQQEEETPPLEEDMSATATAPPPMVATKPKPAVPTPSLKPKSGTGAAPPPQTTKKPAVPVPTTKPKPKPPVKTPNVNGVSKPPPPPPKAFVGEVQGSQEEVVRSSKSRGTRHFPFCFTVGGRLTSLGLFFLFSLSDCVSWGRPILTNGVKKHNLLLQCHNRHFDIRGGVKKVSI